MNVIRNLQYYFVDLFSFTWTFWWDQVAGAVTSVIILFHLSPWQHVHRILLNFKNLSMQAFVVSLIFYGRKKEKLISGIMSTQCISSWHNDELDLFGRIQCDKMFLWVTDRAVEKASLFLSAKKPWIYGSVGFYSFMLVNFLFLNFVTVSQWGVWVFICYVHKADRCSWRTSSS